MPSLTRRSVLAASTGLAVIPFEQWLAEGAWAQAPQRVRYDVASAQGQQMLTKYATAVQRMVGTASGDPCSWTFQWYTHFTKGSSTKAAEIASIYPQPSANRTLAQAMWDTCQAHSAGQDENMFLPWHRMYVLHFEDICRRVLQDPTFTLPYWNYSAAATRVMPAPFRANGSPLFRPNRSAAANGGQPIPANLVALAALQQASFGPQGAAQGFNATLDFGLHGNVHVWIGNNQGMGSVPWAANDPIFWLHHCNIDRLWASWNRAGRANPGGAWLQRSFVFADARCRRIVTSVASIARLQSLSYTYDRFEPVAPVLVAARRAPAAAPPLQLEAAPTATAAAPSPIALGAEPVRVTLQPASRGGPTFGLAPRLGAMQPGRRLYLVLDNAAAQAQPGITYDVYLDLPQGTAPSPEGPYFAGTINFFAAAHPHDAHAGGQPLPRTFSLDVTDMAKDLAARGQLTDTPSVTIVPAGQPDADAKPVIGGVRLVEQ